MNDRPLPDPADSAVSGAQTDVASEATSGIASGPERAGATAPEVEREFAPLSLAERESFLDAIARHRRASWRVTAACAACVLVLAGVVALLMAPLWWVLIGLAFDVANLAVPAPDVLGALFRAIDDATEGRAASPARLASLLALAAAPGLVAMALVTVAIARMLRGSPLFGAGPLEARALGRDSPVERRLGNVVEEMAIAAGLPAPRVLVAAGDAPGAALFGRDDAHATIVVTEGLLARLDRRALQGVAAHLVASFADGDARIGLRVAVVLALFGLPARVGSTVFERGGWRVLPRLAWGALRPGTVAADRLMRDLLDPFAPEDRRGVAEAERRAAAARDGAARRDGRLGWREWAAMPCVGPIAMAGFLAGLVATFALGPLLALAWRRRRYMADAAAVRLVRDPDAVAAALAALGDGGGPPIAPWAAHLGVTRSGRAGGGMIDGSVVPMVPSVERRLKALRRMGSTLAPVARAAMPPWAMLVVAPLTALAGLLMVCVVVLLTWVSTMLSMLFTLLPGGALHALLRWLGR
jgi:Zn-dependent protease with chaperone function